MVSSYEEYLEDKIIKESYILIDMVNEGISIDRMGSILKKILKKIYNLSKDKRRSILKSFVISLITVSPIVSIIEFVGRYAPEESKIELCEVLEDQDIVGDATEMRLSQRGRDLIREHEGYSPMGYDIGDGMITIGWGHAEKKSESKYKVGQRISKSIANNLLKSDLKIAADGIRRMFKGWKESGNYVPITQDMFDALVSLAFNSGVSGLRRSDIIEKLKNKNYESAADHIKEFKVSDRFKGLKSRREIESKLFLSKL